MRERRRDDFHRHDAFRICDIRLLSKQREHILLGLRAHHLALGSAALEQNQRRHAHHAVALGDVGALVDVELVHLGLAGLLSGDFLDYGAKKSTRTGVSDFRTFSSKSVEVTISLMFPASRIIDLKPSCALETPSGQMLGTIVALMRET